MNTKAVSKPTKQDLVVWDKVTKFVSGKLRKITIPEIMEDVDIGKRELERLFKKVVKKPIGEWLVGARLRAVTSFLRNPNCDFDQLHVLMGMEQDNSLTTYLRKHFNITYGMAKQLHSRGRLSTYINTFHKHKCIESFYAEEMIKEIEKRKGKIKSTELKALFDISAAHFYRIWNEYNGPETLHEYASFIEIKCLREEFLEADNTPLAFLSERGIAVHRVDSFHVKHYGETFRSWGGKKIKGKPRHRVNGKEEILGKHWLNVIRVNLQSSDTRIEELAAKINITDISIRKVITHYAGMTYLEYKNSILNSRHSNLTVRSHV